MLVSDELLRPALGPTPHEWRSVPDHRDAAVIAPLVRRDGADHLLYVVRRDDLPHHAGQIAFPGGGREDGETVLACAVRELNEETGIQSAAVDVLGSLPERTSGAGFRVHVLVARVEPPQGFSLDETEIQGVAEVALRDLCDESRWQLRDVQDSGKTFPKVPFFPIGDRWLWGLTARFTRDLLGRLK